MQTIIQANLPVAPRFAYAVNAEAQATPLTRAIAFFGGLFGFNIGTRVREAFTRPGGVGIREYCASVMAFVEVTEIPATSLAGAPEPSRFTVMVMESCLVPGHPKTRELMIIGENLLVEDLEAAKDRGDAVAVGYNSAYREVQALTNADVTTVNNMIEQAIGAQLASMRAAAAQEVSVPEVSLATV